MSEYRFVKFSDFEFIGRSFEARTRHLIEKTDFHKNRGWWKVYYYLPNEVHDDYYGVPKGLNKQELKGFLVEFNFLLNSGYIPRSGAKKLKAKGFHTKDGNFDLFIERYFDEFAVGERTKSQKSIKGQKSVVKVFFKYFKASGKKTISDLTDEDISAWDRNLKRVMRRDGKKLISPSTRIGYRKILKAVLRTAKQNGYSLQCDPEKLEVEEIGKNGKPDKKLGARHIIFPYKLIEAIEKCSYPDPVDPCEPNIKKIPRFLRDEGLRPGELYHLSDFNLFPKKGKPKKIAIKHLPECPNREDMGFSPKTDEVRTVPLSNYASGYLTSLLTEVSKEKRYGRHHKELKEFPFVFVYRDKKTGFLIRDDERLIKELQAVISVAMKEFGFTNEDLGLSPQYDKFEFYDIRRACNYRLKIDMGYSDEKAAEFLGHSVKTNLESYTIPEDFEEINRVRVDRSLSEAMSLDPKIANEYSIHVDNPDGENEDECA